MRFESELSNAPSIATYALGTIQNAGMALGLILLILIIVKLIPLFISFISKKRIVERKTSLLLILGQIVYSFSLYILSGNILLNNMITRTLGTIKLQPFYKENFIFIYILLNITLIIFLFIHIGIPYFYIKMAGTEIQKKEYFIISTTILIFVISLMTFIFGGHFLTAIGI